MWLWCTLVTISYPAAAYELLNKVGPAVYIGHSQGGAEIYTILKSHPDIRFAAAISVEGGNCPDVADVALWKNIPFMYLTGDYRDPPANCPAFIDALNASGGKGTSLYLPSIGILGNDHMMMMDKNSDQVAQVVVDWIEKNVPGAK